MAIDEQSDALAVSPTRRFGTFTGVYLPSLLTVLGVVMYLRLGWMVGHTGLLGALVVISLASAITLLTGISIASTATNMRVGGGGAYYMISRSFGAETGAAVGIPLYLASALGIAFYVTGFAESVNYFFPYLPARVVAASTVIVITALAYKSASMALKAQWIILLAIAISLVSVFLGSPQQEGTAEGLTGATAVLQQL